MSCVCLRIANAVPAARTRTCSRARGPWLGPSRRSCSSLGASTVVPLAYTRHTPPASSPHPPLVILHGLFGGKRNWSSIAKQLARVSTRDVYALDLRNHGESVQQEASAMGFADMAADVAAWIQTVVGRDASPVDILGHSMGGKVAMTLALTPSSQPLVRRLIVADMRPSPYTLSLQFAAYIQRMMEVNSVGGVVSRHAADALLAPVVPDAGVRQFLLTNLSFSPTTKAYAFNLPLQVILDALPRLAEFPAATDPSSSPFPRAVFFLGGAESAYIPKDSSERSHWKKLFTGALEVQHIPGAGHWVHADRPDEFISAVSRFITNDEAIEL